MTPTKVRLEYHSTLGLRVIHEKKKSMTEVYFLLTLRTHSLNYMKVLLARLIWVQLVSF